MEEEIVFEDLEPTRVPVTHKGRKYVLVEASADVGVKYQNACIRAARMEEGHVVGMNDIADAEPLLVSLCLFHVNADGKQLGNVAKKDILSWPNRVVKRLYEKAKDISDLDQNQTVEQLEKSIAKLQQQLDRKRSKEDPNSSGGATTTDGSSTAEPTE